jgi:uncharacterized protein (TIGR04255 family)
VTLADPPSPADQPVTFQDPPVTEVVLAIQFAERVVDLEVLADFTARTKDDFPRRAQRQPLPAMQEEAASGVTGPQISFEIGREFELPRTWFMSEDETKILQRQEDRFVFNWQRPNPEASDYPRYRVLREWFRERLAQLEESIKAAGKAVPGTNFCEVTYVNQVPIEGETGLANILAAIEKPRYDFLPVADNQQYVARFPIGEGDLPPHGALYVNAAPAQRPDGKSMYLINLTSRLTPGDTQGNAAWAALDLGREWIVKGFVDLTTKEMHDLWRYQEGTND